jgi:hypothetical protein
MGLSQVDDRKGDDRYFNTTFYDPVGGQQMVCLTEALALARSQASLADTSSPVEMYATIRRTHGQWEVCHSDTYLVISVLKPACFTAA